MPRIHIAKFTGPGTYISPYHKGSRPSSPAFPLIRTFPARAYSIQALIFNRMSYLKRELSHRQFYLQPIRFSSDMCIHSIFSYKSGFYVATPKPSVSLRINNFCSHNCSSSYSSLFNSIHKNKAYTPYKVNQRDFLRQLFRQDFHHTGFAIET